MLGDGVLPFTFGCEVEYNGSDECSQCYGEGSTECFHCYGDGRFTCPHCGGCGELYSVSDDGVEVADPCPVCDSDGSLDCSDCDSSGYVTCEYCGGDCSDDRPVPRGWDVKGEHCGTEFVSPPMSDPVRMFRDLRNLASANAGYGTDDCGFHIHLSVNPLDSDAVDPVSFFRRWQTEKYDRIYPHVPKGVHERHDTQWCQLISDITFSEWQQSFGRYQELNPLAVTAHGTLEVRLGGSSEDGDELVRFLTAVLELANECRYEASSSVNDRLAYLRVHTPTNSPLHVALTNWAQMAPHE